jgi:proteasome activator subunit 3 (PA28 gamma)
VLEIIRTANTATHLALVSIMTLTMDTEIAAKFETFKTIVASQGEETVFRVFPSKVLQLQSLIDSTSSSASPFHPSCALTHTDTTIYSPPSGIENGEEPHAKKRKRDDASDQTTAINGTSSLSNALSHCVYPNLVKSNKNMSKLHEIIRQEAQELATFVDKVKVSFPRPWTYGFSIPVSSSG